MNTLMDSLKVALKYRQKNNFKEADQIYCNILKDNPKQVDALAGLASLATQEGKYEIAEKIYMDALKTHPESVKIMFSMANFYQLTEKYNKAIDIYKTVLSQNPKKAVIYNNLGYALQECGQFEEAINCYKKALTIQPECVEAEVNLGNLLFEKKLLTLNEKKKYADINNYLGKDRFDIGDYKNAENFFKKAILLQPELSIFHFNLGFLYQKIGLFEEAASCYQTSISLEPKSAQFRYHLAYVLQLLDKGQESSFQFYKENQVKVLDLKIHKQSSYDAIYHCCVQKTASQWFRSVFRDPLFYQNTGLLMYPYIELGLRSAEIDYRFPEKVIATHLYINYSTYCKLEKPPNIKTFFVTRDPRDSLISWYFSAKKSHVPVGPIRKLREELSNLTIHKGLLYLIDFLNEIGYFDAQLSWEYASEHDNSIRIFRYEDLCADNLLFMKRLFTYLDISIPESELHTLSSRHCFKRLSGGRSQGEENTNSHYRKAVVGDWVNYCDQPIIEYLKDKTGNIVEKLGYL